MKLLSANERKALGIDTLERAAIWSIQSLRANSLTHFPQSSENIRISQQTEREGGVAKVIAEVKLSYKASKALNNSSDYLNSITEFSEIVPSKFEKQSKLSTGLKQQIPQEPNEIDSLEKYLAWASFILLASSYPQSYVSFNPLEDYLLFNYSLPFNYPYYLITNNLIESSQVITDYYLSNPSQVDQVLSLPPSPQFWLNPVAKTSDLPSTGLNPGVMIYVLEEKSPYVFQGDEGWLKVGIEGTDSALKNSYYGTNFEGKLGFWPLPKARAESPTAKVKTQFIFVVDESTGMDHSFIPDLVDSLAENFEANYGLVGYGTREHGGGFFQNPHTHQVGGANFGQASEFKEALKELVADGGIHDGYEAILYALNNYSIDFDTTLNIVLITDDDREETTSDTYDSVLSSLKDKARLTVVVDNPLGSASDNLDAIGIDGSKSYFADGNDSFSTVTGSFVGDGNKNTETDYVALALATQGTAWNINQVSKPEFALAFAQVLAEKVGE